MKKIKKTKTGLTVTLGFAAVALLSVGFSAWVVNLDSSKDTGNVSVEVADTTTNSVTITTGMIDSAFKFDAPKDDDEGPITFSGDPEVDGEDLSFSFWVKLAKTGSNNAINVNFQKYSAEGYAPNYDLLKAMVEDADAVADGNQQYIEAPFNFDGTTKTEIIGSDFSNSAADDTKYDKYYATGVPSIDVNWDATNSRYTVKMYFRWGSYTENMNPSLYDTTNLSKSTTVLNYLETNKEALKLEKVRLTISHTY